MIAAYVFPGQGAQHVGMGVELAASSEAAAGTFTQASEAIGIDILDLCKKGPEAALQDTEIAQPALLTVSLAALAAAQQWLPAPAFMAGLSLGEYTALAASGALTLEAAVRLVRERGRLMKDATRHRDLAMAAIIGLETDVIAGLCASVGHLGCCQIALYNAPRHVVVSGDRIALNLLVELAERGNARATMLRVSSAFHTTLMTPMAPYLDALLADIDLRRPAVPVISNVTAQPVEHPDDIRDYLIRQLDHPVRWSETIAYLVNASVDTLLELGAGRVLSRLGRANSRKLTTLSVEDRATLTAIRDVFSDIGTTASPPITTIASNGKATRMYKTSSITGFVPIPERRAERYRLTGHWTGELLDATILTQAAREPADRPALVAGSDTMSYGELLSRVGMLATHLRNRGIGRQDRVVVQLPNGPAFVVFVLALWRIGAIAVMALPSYGEHELRHIIEMSDAVAMAVPCRIRRENRVATARRLFAEHPTLSTLFILGPDSDVQPGDVQHGDVQPGEIDLSRLMRTPATETTPAEPPAPSDLALLLLSGGTTGMPKLIPRTHDDYRYNIEVSSEICRFDRDTIYLAALPTSHNFALGCPGIMGTLYHGGRVVFSQAPHAQTLLDTIVRNSATVTAVVPTLAAQLADAAMDRGIAPSTLQLLQVGGARLLPETARRVRTALRCTLQQVYGMAEGLLNFTRLDDPVEDIEQTQGRPASASDEIRIVDESGHDVPEGQPGELLTRGPYTIAGYFRASQHNVQAFDGEGYFRTGDIVRRTTSGNLVVEGRLKDVINRAGEKISAAELENLMLQHPAMQQVAAVAAPDSWSGESICVFATLRSGAELKLAQLRSFLLERGIARYKLPDRLELLTELPATAVGKLDKVTLRRWAAGEQR